MNSIIERNKVLFITGVLVKVLCGLGVTILFRHYYQHGDMLSYYSEGIKLSKFFLSHPLDFLLLHDSAFNNTDFAGQPRAIFFLMLVTPILALTGNNLYITSIILSIVSFLGSWRLALVLSKYYPSLRTQVLLVFLFLPSYILWTSGLMKESISNAAICICVSEVVYMAQIRKPKVVSIIWLVVCFWILLKLKYYVFGALLPVLFTYFLIKKISRAIDVDGFLRIPLLLPLLITGGFISIQFHSYLNPNNWAEIILASNQHIPGLETNFQSLTEIISMVFNALWNSWVSILPWDAQNILQFLAGIFNLMFICLIAVSALLNRNPIKWKAEAFLVIAYSLAGGILLGLSITNFGSIERLRTSFYPFLVLLITAGIPQLKSTIKTIFARVLRIYGKASNNFRSKGIGEGLS